jgi:hypothetical protein
VLSVQINSVAHIHPVTVEYFHVEPMRLGAFDPEPVPLRGEVFIRKNLGIHGVGGARQVMFAAPRFAHHEVLHDVGLPCGAGECGRLLRSRARQTEKFAARNAKAQAEQKARNAKSAKGAASLSRRF